MPPDLLNFCRLAKARYVAIGPSILLAAPRVISARHLINLFVRQLLVYSRSFCKLSKLAGIDEKHLTASITPFASGVLVAGEKPEAGRNRRRIKELTRQRHHAIDDIGLDHRAANFIFAGLVGRH